jgi:hypothetical protein
MDAEGPVQRRDRQLLEESQGRFGRHCRICAVTVACQQCVVDTVAIDGECLGILRDKKKRLT